MATDILDTPKSRRRRGLTPGALALHALLIAGSALKLPADIFTYPPVWIPNPIAWQNYAKTVTVMPFGRFYLNSLIVTTGVTLLQLLTSSLAAFAFARMRFPGRNAL